MGEPQHSLEIITAELPPDILFCNILPRLPAKPLLRFRCVSKEWNSLLRTPLFEDMHLHHLTNDDHQNHHKLLVLSTKPPFVFHTIDCEAPEDGLTASRPLPFDNSSPENLNVLTSFGGLVCVGLNWDRFFHHHSNMILWNPSTGEYKTLSKCIFDPINYVVAYGLYYSFCDDSYKLLCVTLHCDVYIFSLKSDTWRQIDSNNKQLKGICHGCYWSPSIPVKEKLYFLYYKYHTTETEPSYLIIRFDTKTEKFTVIATPFPMLTYQTITTTYLMGHQGCLQLYVAYRNNHMGWSIVELWRLDGDADWKKVVTYPIQTIAACYTKPLHLMSDGTWLRDKESEGVVYKIDFASDIQNASCSYNSDTMYICPRGKYIETLVSPNRYL